MTNKPTKVSDVYTLYLKPWHLPSAGIDVTITSAHIADLHPRPGSEETKPGIVLSFKGATRKLVLNGGNAGRMVDLGGDDPDHWMGLVIRLKPAPLTKTKQTIIIEPASTKQQADVEAGGEGAEK